jgi:hypothetical protein
VIHQQLQLLWPLVAALLAISVFALYVFCHTDRNYRLKLLLMPALLLAAATSFTWLGQKLGYASPHELPASFEYVTHRLVLVGDRKSWLDILVVSRTPLERDARLHRVRWTKELEDALSAARQMQRQDEGWVEMQRDADGSTDAQRWKPRRVLPQHAMPKPAPTEDRRDLLAPNGPSL